MVQKSSLYTLWLLYYFTAILLWWKCISEIITEKRHSSPFPTLIHFACNHCFFSNYALILFMYLSLSMHISLYSLIMDSLSLSVCLFTLYLTLCTQKLSLSHHVLIPSYPDYVLIYCLSHHELTFSLLDCLITVYLIMYSLLVHLLIYCMSPLVLNSSFPSCVISYCLPHHVLTSSISNFVIIYSLSHHVLIYWAVFFVLQHCKQQTKDHSEWECETSAFFFFVLCSFKMYTIMALLSFLS